MNVKKRTTFKHDFTPKWDYLVARYNDESMRNIGIFKGSIVVIHKQRTAEDEDIIAVKKGDKAYIRRYKQFGETVMLMPTNPEYEAFPLILGDDMMILGKVVQVANYFD